MTKTMTQLDALEAQSVYIFREAYRSFKQLVMLWSIGKDSTVMLWLARKAFFGHVPIPLVHIDTAYKIPEMIEYRDKLATRVYTRQGEVYLLERRMKTVMKNLACYYGADTAAS